MEQEIETESESESESVESLLASAKGGDERAVARLFDRYRRRLRQMIRLRIDRRLQGRVDPSDVLQEAYVDLAQQMPSYVDNPKLPFFLWLRLLVGQRLMRVHRQHLGAAMRDAGREVSLHRGPLPHASSASMAAQLMGRFTTASEAASRAERKLRIQAVLDRMDDLDREIIALRHFEELSNGEAAAVLGLSKSAASNRYVRALTRLQSELSQIPGFIDQTTR